MDSVKKIAIATDTNSGMMPREHEAEGIFVLPMPFIVDGVSQLESVELSRDDFYEKLISDADISTSQPSVGELTEFWTEILKTYDEVVHIPTSSVLSNSYATALTLSKEFDGKVRVVDNRRISIALKASVFDAVALREQGKSAEEIQTVLEDMRTDYSVYVSIETMKYLKKGGRVSPAAAAIGSMLKLRPVLRLCGDKLEKFALPRTLVKPKELMLKALLDDLAGKYKESLEKGEMRLCIAYANNAEDAFAFREEVEKRIPNVPILWNDPISLSIACHTGPQAISLSCMRIVK